MSKQDLITGLNEDLAAELGTVIRYTYQSSKAMGFIGFELREILEDEIADELGHAAFLRRLGAGGSNKRILRCRREMKVTGWQ